MLLASLRRYFISGLLVLVPIWVTVLAVNFLFTILNATVNMLPEKYKPDTLLGVHIPGMGVIVTLLIILLTGIIVANFIGKRLVALGDSLISRIPLVRSIYTAVKQVIDTIFTPGGKSFRKVLLVEYPRKGLWSIAFQTGDGISEANNHIEGGEGEVVTIFIPTTPNPTSGFLMIVPSRDVYEMEMSIDQALKFVISLGVVQPGSSSNGINNLKKVKQGG